MRENSKGRDCLVWKLARTWRQWCHTSTCESQRKGRASQRAQLHVFRIPTGHTLKKAYLEEWLYAGGDSSEEQIAVDVPMLIGQGAGQLKTERSEGDRGFTIDVAAVHRHER